MNEPEGMVRPVLVGNCRFHRYAIAASRSPSSPTRYWTGRGEAPWTAEVSGAMRWADYGAVLDAIHEMGRVESDDSPGGK